VRDNNTADLLPIPKPNFTSSAVVQTRDTDTYLLISSSNMQLICIGTCIVLQVTGYSKYGFGHVVNISIY
jgi:hypothetical protein